MGARGIHQRARPFAGRATSGPSNASAGALRLQRQISEAATQPPLFISQLKQHFWPVRHCHFVFLPSMVLATQAFPLAAAASKPAGAASMNPRAHPTTNIDRNIIVHSPDANHFTTQ
jgi:hypothetical protein